MRRAYSTNLPVILLVWKKHCRKCVTADDAEEIELVPTMIADRHRSEFPTLASGIHLLSHSLGPVPRAARESMSAYIDAWEHHTGEDAWATSWWELRSEEHTSELQSRFGI